MILRKLHFSKASAFQEWLLIISVLVGLVNLGVPRIKNVLDESHKADVQKELKALSEALDSYYTNSRDKLYPTISTTPLSSYLLQTRPKVLEKSVTDPYNPIANSEYIYKKSFNSKYFMVASVGANKTLGSRVTIDNSGRVTGLDVDDICMTNGQGCTNLQVCGNYQCAVCVGGGCGFLNGEPCSTSKDCMSGYCSKASRSCTSGELGVDCNAQAECQEGYFCANLICSLTNGEVGDSCVEAAQCASGYCSSLNYHCTDGVIGSSCGKNSECATGYCSSKEGLCTDGSGGVSCGDNLECISGICDHNTCKSSGHDGDPCKSHENCNSGHCDLSLGICGGVGSKELGSPCEEGSECIYGVCSCSKVCTAGVAGNDCCSDSDCQSGKCDETRHCT